MDIGNRPSLKKPILSLKMEMNTDGFKHKTGGYFCKLFRFNLVQSSPVDTALGEELCRGDAL